MILCLFREYSFEHVTPRPDDVWRIFDCSKYKH